MFDRNAANFSICEVDMLRSLFLLLSESPQLKQWSSESRLAQMAARRFVAGDTIQDAIDAIRDANRQGISATLDHLGENTESEVQAITATQEYINALENIAQSGVDSSVSVKLTQLGLDLGTEFCRDNVAQVAAKAQQVGTYVRIDMEGSEHTARTLKVLFALRADYDNVGVVIQAYLYRSETDVERLIDTGVPVRLCKGAYKEPSNIAFPDKADVDQNMIDLMHRLLGEKARANGARLGMATHDEKMIAATKAYAAAHNIPKDAFEFQMLYGVRPGLQREIAAAGYNMRVYIPYGTEWYPYYLRRLGERPANVWFILSNLLRG
jgi:proline dehydrogenase